MKDTGKTQGGVLFEPSLQRKKRLDGPLTCLSSDFSVKTPSSNDDYILLGRNEKFQGNICYKPKRHFKIKKNETSENQKCADDESCDPHIQMENIDKTSVNGKVPGDYNEGTPTNDEEYILLGNHAKFSDNIVYKQKKRMNKYAETELDLNEIGETQKCADDESCDPHIQMENIDTTSVNGKVPGDYNEGTSTNDEEYILLGNHAKFSDNIVYKQKKKMNKYAETELDLEIEDQYPTTRKDLKPAPVIDTSKFTKSSHAIMLDNLKTNDKPINELTDKINKDTVDDCTDKENTKVEIDEVVNPEKSQDKRSVMFEGVSPQNHSDSEQKLLSLLYKSGLSAPRYSTLRISEYQKNFTLKKPIKADSIAQKSKKLIQAGSYFNQASSQNNYSIKKSEYQSNFGTPVTDKSVKSNTSVAENNDNSCPKKMKHSRRSKSVNSKRTERIGELTKSVLTEDGYSRIKKSSQPIKSAKSLSTNSEVSASTSPMSSSRRTEDRGRARTKYGIKRSKSFEAIASPEPKEKEPPTAFMSEYQKNFSSPSSFAYVNNSWVCDNAQVTTENTTHQDWYKQVLELREKAAEYRQRAFDSHFCSKHMVQLIARETEIWENSKKLSNMSHDVSQMKAAGITYYQPNTYFPKTTNNFKSAKKSPRMNNKGEIALDFEEVPVSDTGNSELVRYHQNQECNNDVTETSKSKTTRGQDQNLCENENKKSVPEKEESITLNVESITEMINKNDPRSWDKADSGSMNTRIDSELLEGNNSKLSLKAQPVFTRQHSDDKLAERHQEVDEEISSYLHDGSITESKDLYTTAINPSTIDITLDEKDYHTDADKETRQLELVSKVSERFQKPKQYSKSCDSMFTKAPFGKSTQSTTMIQRQQALLNAKPAKKLHNNFQSTNKPVSSFYRENNANKKTKPLPLKSQENIPFKPFARPKVTSALRPHYEHMSDTYSVPRHSHFDPDHHEAPLNKNTISESLNSSSSLISDVLERTRSRMNFW